MARTHFGRSLVLVCAVVLALPGVVLAASDEWKDATSGSFSDPVRWVDGSAPTATDSAEFSATGTYHVLFDYDPVNLGLLVSGAGVDVTFHDDGGARLYSLTDPGGPQDVEVVNGGALPNSPNPGRALTR